MRAGGAAFSDTGMSRRTTSLCPNVSEARRVVPAVGLEGASIAAGAEVVIERIENGIAHVELWSNIERELEKLS